MNAETRLAELLETQWVPTNKPVLFADITEAVGLESTALVVGTIKAASAQNPLMETILIAMSSVGLSLSTAERQGVIDSLAVAGSWPDSVRDAVKALGGVTRPKWVGAGYVSEPTLDQITAEINAEQAIADETRYEVLLSANRGTDGAMRVMARVTPVEFADGIELRRGTARTIVNDADLIASLSQIVGGLIDG